VFRPDRGGLDDRVAMPKLRGQLVDACATVGDDRAWLWLTLADAGRLSTLAIVIDAQARVLATATIDAPWVAGVAGACAAGPHLFVPTDDGIARIEIVAAPRASGSIASASITQTRLFAETAPLVSAADRLALHPSGLDVIRARDAIRLHLT
jgi:hypothetical protein